MAMKPLLYGNTSAVQANGLDMTIRGTQMGPGPGHTLDYHNHIYHIRDYEYDWTRIGSMSRTAQAAQHIKYTINPQTTKVHALPSVPQTATSCIFMPHGKCTMAQPLKMKMIS
jgi:hypothetical protein